MRLELQKLCAGYGGGSVLREISAGFETGQLSVIVGAVIILISVFFANRQQATGLETSDQI